MNFEMIKEFLVGLGFDVDESSYKRFMKSIADATLKVTALYVSIKAMAAGTFFAISKTSEAFEEMGYQYRIIAPAINKALILRREMLKAYAAAGVNVTQAVVGAVKFNMALTKVQYTLKAMAQGVAVKFFPLLTKQLDTFRKNLYANMPKIQAGLEKFVKFVFKAFEAVNILGMRIWSILSRVYEFFGRLHDATNGWSTTILAVLAAWKFLNLAFLATPLGMLIAGLATLLALWDDFKTFQEGGESLIDWGSDATKTFVGIAASVVAVGAAIYGVVQAIALYRAAVTGITVVMGVLRGALLASKLAMVAFNLVAALNPIGLVVLAIGALIAALTVLIVKWDAIKAGFASFFSGLGGKILTFFGGAENAAANIGSVQGNVAGQAPVGVASAANNNVNQSVNQETNITVMGTADANATGKAVTAQQANVNRDMVRNLKGATTPAGMMGAAR